MRLLAIVWVGLLGLAVVGCSGDGLIDVHGTVKLDGNPIEDGTIQFLPEDGKGPSAAARIQQGEYSVRTTSGKKKVKIEGYQTVGEERHNDQPDAPMIAIKKPIVPEKFNKKTELTRKISSDTCDFDLKTD